MPFMPRGNIQSNDYIKTSYVKLKFDGIPMINDAILT